MSEQNNSSENIIPDVNSPRNSPVTVTVETDNLPTPPSETDTVEVMPPTPPEPELEIIKTEEKSCEDEKECCDDEKECCGDDAKCCEDEKECCEEKTCCEDEKECCEYETECCGDGAECCEDEKECCEEKTCCEEKKNNLPPLEIPSPNYETPPILSVELNDKTLDQKQFFDDNELRKDVKTLSHCITVLLMSTDVADKYSLIIDDKTRSILNTLFENENYFDTIEDLFKRIIKDDKIDANDVPLIMTLLVELYIILKNKKPQYTLVNCGEVLKLIFTVIIKEKLVPINDKELELLRCLYNIIEMSVHLSQAGSDNKKDGLFACLKNCFK